MVALTAIGMIVTTTAHAAPIDGGSTAVYGNPVTDPGHPTVPGHPNTGVGSGIPTDPGNPTVPGHPGTQFRPDIKVTWKMNFHLGNVHNASFHIENIGPGTAKSVKIHTGVVRVQVAPTYGPIISLGEMAPGAQKDVAVTCTDQPGAECMVGFAEAWLTDDLNNRWGNDANFSNNVEFGWSFDIK
jgi:hypothetical protein